MSATRDYDFRAEASKLERTVFPTPLTPDQITRIRAANTLHHVSVLPPNVIIHCFVAGRNRYFCKLQFCAEEIITGVRLADCIQYFFAKYRRRQREVKYNVSEAQAIADLADKSNGVEYILQGLRNILDEQGVLPTTDKFLQTQKRKSHDRVSKYVELCNNSLAILRKLELLEKEIAELKERLNAPMYLPPSPFTQPNTTPGAPGDAPYIVTCQSDSPQK